MRQRKKRHLIYAILAVGMTLFTFAGAMGAVGEDIPTQDEIVPIYGKVEALDLDVMRRGARNVDITIKGTDYTYFY